MNKKACRMLEKAPRSQAGKQKGVLLGTHLYSYDEKIGHKSPRNVIHVERNVFTLEFEGKFYTSSYNHPKKVETQVLGYYLDKKCQVWAQNIVLVTTT